MAAGMVRRADKMVVTALSFAESKLVRAYGIIYNHIRLLQGPSNDHTYVQHIHI
jgi:hypothetical protein